MRWTVLAGTRFILAGVVLVGHMSLFDPVGHQWTQIGIFFNQGSAVYGFLIISGYSIAASLERSKRGFFSRRFWRIFPTYIASLVLAVVAGLFITGSLKSPSGFTFYPATAYDAIIALIMLQSFIGPTISTDGQLWTLAVEWWNYMLAPLFKKSSAIIIGILIFVSLTAYLLFPAPVHPNESAHGFVFIILSWYWLVGFLYYRYRNRQWGFAVLIFPILIAMVNGWVGRAAVIGIMAVALCEQLKVPQRLAGFIEWLGELSYPIYALHVPVLVFCLLFHIRSPVLTLIASIVVSIAVLHIVDLPLRKWGVRFSKRIRNRIAERHAQSDSPSNAEESLPTKRETTATDPMGC
jgi:peptidoglycan/LPS O-acetylase OafA/YrhL